MSSLHKSMVTCTDGDSLCILRWQSSFDSPLSVHGVDLSTPKPSMMLRAHLTSMSAYA